MSKIIHWGSDFGRDNRVNHLKAILDYQENQTGLKGWLQNKSNPDSNKNKIGFGAAFASTIATAPASGGLSIAVATPLLIGYTARQLLREERLKVVNLRKDEIIEMITGARPNDYDKAYKYDISEQEDYNKRADFLTKVLEKTIVMVNSLKGLTNSYNPLKHKEALDIIGRTVNIARSYIDSDRDKSLVSEITDGEIDNFITHIKGKISPTPAGAGAAPDPGNSIVRHTWRHQLDSTDTIKKLFHTSTGTTVTSVAASILVPPLGIAAATAAITNKFIGLDKRRIDSSYVSDQTLVDCFAAALRGEAVPIRTKGTPITNYPEVTNDIYDIDTKDRPGHFTKMVSKNGNIAQARKCRDDEGNKIHFPKYGVSIA